jgi:hypothetical protein
MSNLFLFVAIGRPGEPLPPWGAYRLYVPAEDWKAQITMLISIASVIIVRCGESDALRWEIDQLQQSKKLERTLLLLPTGLQEGQLPSLLPNDSRFEIDAPPLPTYKGYAAFVTLNSDGARVHHRDLKVRYGEAARRVVVETFQLGELTRSGRRTIRGFYGPIERLLSNVTQLCVYGFVFGMGALMLSGLLLLIPILLTEGRTEDAVMDWVAPVFSPLLIGSGIVAAVSILLLMLMVALGERTMPWR